MKYMDLDITNNAIATNTEITSENANKLRLKWFFKTKYIVSGSPIIRGHYIYFADWGGNVYCANKYSGKLLWKLHIYTPPSPCACPHPEQPGIYASPYPYTGFATNGIIIGKTWYLTSCGGKVGPPLCNGGNAKLFAIDIKNAKVLYCNTITDSEWGCSIAKPLYYDGFLYLGICGVDRVAKNYALTHNLPFRSSTKGYVVAVKASTGMTAWTADIASLLPEDLPTATGAGIYSSFALCPKTGMLYFGTGCNYTLPASSTSNSLLALNYRTGDYIWHFKLSSVNTLPPMPPLELRTEYAPAPQIFDYYHLDDRVPAIGIADCAGYYYILNRVTGRELRKIRLFIGSPFQYMPDEYCSAKAIASINDGKIYIGSNNGIITTSSYYDSLQTMSVFCLDASNGKPLWFQVQDGFLHANAGILCNDVFLIGNSYGRLICYNQTTGDILNYQQIPSVSIASSLTADESSIYFGCGRVQYRSGFMGCGVYNYELCE